MKSALARVIVATNRFMSTKDPVDFLAWSEAHEEIVKEDALDKEEELDKVGGGICTRPYVLS